MTAAARLRRRAAPLAPAPDHADPRRDQRRDLVGARRSTSSPKGARSREELERQARSVLEETTTDAVSLVAQPQLIGVQVAEIVAEANASRGPPAPRDRAPEDPLLGRAGVPKVRRQGRRDPGAARRPRPTSSTPRSDLIFDHGDFDPESALRLIEARAAARTRSRSRERACAGRDPRRRASRGAASTCRSWTPPTASGVFDPFEPLRRVIVIAVLGTLVLAGAIYLFLARSVIRPLEALGRVATAAAQRRLLAACRSRPRGDEVGSVIEAQNRMMALIQDYSANMENKVREGVEMIDRKSRELVMAQRLAAIGTLAAGIAHEINNPLGGMLNAALRLKRRDLTDEARDEVRRAARGEHRADRETVRRVLDLTPRRTTPGPVSLPGRDPAGVRPRRMARHPQEGVALHPRGRRRHRGRCSATRTSRPDLPQPRDQRDRRHRRRRATHAAASPTTGPGSRRG